MATRTGQPGPHRSRRTSSDVEETILAATLEVLNEVGFKGLTVEAVAARAGSAKTAVYRRWPSKVPLVVDALTHNRALPEPPDTGDLRTDMIEIWKRVATGSERWVEQLLPVVTSYLTEDDDLMTTLRERYFQPRLEALRTVVARAVERGEIQAGTDPALAFDLLFGPLAYRWLRGLPPDEETITRLTDLVLQGLRPHGPPS